MVDLIDTVQDQEIDDAYLELFDINLRWVNSAGDLVSDIIHLVDGLDNDNLNLWMPYDNSGSLEWAEYIACPIAIEGVSLTSTGAPARPTLSIANVVSLARTISSSDGVSYGDGDSDETNFSTGGSYNADANTVLAELNISKNEDILGSIVNHRKTLRKNTYVKISGSYYTYSDRSTTITGVPAPKEFPSGRFVLDRVSAENNLVVQYELASPFDVQGLKIPNRYVIGKYCPWDYRGAAGTTDSIKSGCTWNGGGYTIDNDSVSANSAGDVCAKTVQACKVRFHGAEDADSDIPLPFGGFPGSRKFK
jgi:lambda family phage minor tail protein L